MKNKLLRLSLAVSFAVLCLSAAPARADFIAPTGPVTFGASWDGPGNSLQDVLNNITANPTPGVSSVTTTADTILDSWDTWWKIGGQGQSAATLVIEIAGYATSNEFGLYDAANSAIMAPIFTGSESAGAQSIVSILLDGSVIVKYVDSGKDFAGNLFGFYLDTPDGIFYSDTGLNTDNFDHLRAYQGKGIDDIQVGSTLPGLWQTNIYALGWEDLFDGGDRDYQDMVLMIESVVPVPIPAAVLLGVIGLGVVGWKLRKFA